LLDGFRESSVTPCRILSANEFAPVIEHKIYGLKDIFKKDMEWYKC